MQHQCPTRQHAAIALVGLVLTAGSAVARGGVSQPADQMPAARPSAASAARVDAYADWSSDRHAAAEVARFAMLDLRTRATPEPADYRIAIRLLEIAETLSPGDPQLPRKRVAAAWAAGDDEALLDATRRVVQLDPADTVAQLRLITARIAAMQTAEERLTAYDRFLGPQGARLDASIRSRLALDAALLLRERADEAGFVARLKDAVALDGTNKDAALLAYTYYADKVNSARGRVELLANLLYADPLDAKTIYSLSDELAHGGAYVAARRFFNLATDLEGANGVRPDVRQVVASIVLDWRADGAQGALEFMNRQIATERAEATRASRSDFLTGSSVVDPSDVRLALPFEEVRLAAAIALKDDAAVRLSMNDYAKTVRQQSSILLDPTRRGDMDANEAQTTANIIEASLHVWRLFSGIDADKAAAEAPDFLTKLDPNDPSRVAIEAWLALRAGDHVRSVAILDASPDAVEWGDIARAEIARQAGDTALAGRLYRRVGITSPLLPLGALATERAKELGAWSVTGEAAPLEAYAKTIPAWIDQMFRQPRNFQSLRVSLEASPDQLRQTQAADLVPVRVALRNMAPIPLGLGPDRAMSSRIFFGPRLDLGVVTLTNSGLGEVVDLDQRLRLMPGETLETVVHPEIGFGGWAIQTNSAAPSRLRWNLLQGFQADATGPRRAGPGSVETSSDTIVRASSEEARISATELAQRIALAPEGRELARVLTGVKSQLVAIGVEQALQTQATILVDALAARFESLSPTFRLYIAATLPVAVTSPRVAALDQLFLSDPDPRVRTIGLIRLPPDATDAAIGAAEADKDTGLAGVAVALRARLSAGGDTYASVGAPTITLARPTPVPVPSPSSTSPPPAAPPMPAPAVSPGKP